jgi:3-hydroxyisobutyrate dehydrogenase-like beta-hydroxyacid dehydrogenase
MGHPLASSIPFLFRIERSAVINNIGFIGLGTMGAPMAANLLKAGFGVGVVAHRNRAPVEELVRAGAVEYATAADLAAQVEALFTCISNDAAVEKVLLGAQGVAEGGRAGLIVADTSTISPLTAQRLAGALAERGITLLDAPISGGQGGAEAGTLAIMVGGPRAAFDALLPALQAMGKSIAYIGGNGAALVVKLANNLIVAAAHVAIAEAFTLAAKAGVDPALVQKVLSTATARSPIIEDKLPRTLLVGNLKPGFKLSLMRKDMGLATAYGAALGVPMPITATVHELYTQALGLGKGDLDCIGVAELYTAATGVSLTAQEK